MKKRSKPSVGYDQPNSVHNGGIDCNVGSDIDMKFNARKSSLLCVGKHFSSNIDDLHVGNEDIMWKDSVKYFGVWLCSGKRLQSDINSIIRKFYAAANSNFSHSGSISQMSKLHLVESYCLPMLTYTVEALYLKNSQISKLNTCWNNAYRRIVRINAWESVTDLQCFCGKSNLKIIYNRNKKAQIF